MKILLICLLLTSLTLANGAHQGRKAKEGFHSESKSKRLAKPRIFEGDDIRRGQFPEVVQVTSFNKTDYLRFGVCTGVIIGPDTVLTAAHCLKSDRYFVNTGIKHIVGVLQSEYQVVQVCKHPRWDPKGNNGHPAYDYAVLRVDRPFTLSKDVKVGELGGSESVFEEGETMGVIVGAGLIGLNPDTYPDILQYLPVMVVECPRKDKHPSHVCYLGDSYINPGVEVGGTCDGDSGGPVLRMKWSEGPHDIIVIHSYAYGCGRGRINVGGNVPKDLFDIIDLKFECTR